MKNSIKHIVKTMLLIPMLFIVGISFFMVPFMVPAFIIKYVIAKKIDDDIIVFPLMKAFLFMDYIYKD